MLAGAYVLKVPTRITHETGHEPTSSAHPTANIGAIEGHTTSGALDDVARIRNPCDAHRLRAMASGTPSSPSIGLDCFPLLPEPDDSRGDRGPKTAAQTGADGRGGAVWFVRATMEDFLNKLPQFAWRMVNSSPSSSAEGAYGTDACSVSRMESRTCKTEDGPDGKPVQKCEVSLRVASCSRRVARRAA